MQIPLKSISGGVHRTPSEAIISSLCWKKKRERQSEAESFQNTNIFIIVFLAFCLRLFLKIGNASIALSN
ncbi:hypothetical protein A2X44_00265 [candidate division CPR3 bacterium GWF2_35_18]|nr:MAG: hypothetical protein A2X44_00265 [candidate division CPR3 bacterium GWF2_35_18]